MFFGLCILMFSANAGAAEFGTKDEAVALVAKAIAHAGQVGMDKAVTEFSDPKGKWVDRDLYLIVVDKTGNRIAHGQNVKMIGKSYAESIDVNGKAYGKEVMDAAAAGKGKGWVDYYFTDPITKKQMLKSAYWEKSGDNIFVCGVYMR
jgi:signal transduction histidine kinase